MVLSNILKIKRIDLVVKLGTSMKYIFSKACNESDRRELAWLWVSTYHLMSVKTGLCLTAPYELDSASLTGVTIYCVLLCSIY